MHIEPGVLGAGMIMVANAALAVVGEPALTLLREPTLSIVLFERHGWEPADYDRWAAQLLDDQVALVTSSKWEGRTVGRLVFLHPRTTRELVTQVLAAMA